jgi:hypothetical protein
MDTRFLLAAVAAATLAACGGGGDGGGGGFQAVPLVPPPAPAPAPAPSPAPAPAPNPDNTSSAACFNEADLHEGTTSVVELDITSNGETLKQRVTTVTRTRESFADATPVRLLRTSFNYFNNSEATDRQYIDFVDGKILRYGSRNGGEDADPGLGTNTNVPTFAMPVMSPGQTLDINYVVKTVSAAGNSEQPISGTDTYVGRETLETPMGAISACKFSGVGRFQQVDGSELVQNQDNWIAADGPYRGQMLKLVTRIGEGVSTVAATKITYTPK